jgi:hypothetical protein
MYRFNADTICCGDRSQVHSPKMLNKASNNAITSDMPLGKIPTKISLPAFGIWELLSKYLKSLLFVITLYPLWIHLDKGCVVIRGIVNFSSLTRYNTLRSWARNSRCWMNIFCVVSLRLYWKLWCGLPSKWTVLENASIIINTIPPGSEVKETAPKPWISAEPVKS